MTAPLLPADGLLLRPWTADDVPAVLALIDDVALRWSPSLRPVKTPEHAQKWLETRIASDTHWAVTNPVDGRVVGRVGLHDVSPDDARAEIGYGVTPGERGKGVARRAAAAVVAYGFAARPEGLGLVRIELQHAVGNRASCRVASVSGFAFEGLNRQSISAPDGLFDDGHLHARLASDAPGPIESGIEPTELVAGAYQLCIPNPSIDVEPLLAVASDPDIARWNALPVGLEAVRAWCAGRADWSEGKHASWLIKDTVGTLLGQISVFQIDRANGSCQVGYWVAPEARRRGVASAALDAARRFAFDGLELSRMELFHAVENTASCGVALRAGFQLEGTHRSSYRYGDGLLHDEHSHARLASDG